MQLARDRNRKANLNEQASNGKGVFPLQAERAKSGTRGEEGEIEVVGS